ncbi:peptidase inhibitor family I36 protein [Streptomyces sp. NPDC001985]|uniref:peptidase inhibitor family I36 protein n=1 Tax=Streptomyces sp. NPDC001985 TaxID=3154406 RepID=UPI003331F729
MSSFRSGLRRVSLSAVAVSAVVASTLGTGVARAEVSPATTCPANRVCFYPGANFQGTPTIIDFTATPGCKEAFRARSVINNRIYPVGLYVDSECTQYLDQVDAGDTRSNLIAGVVTADG